jgi:hypothetical protein
MNEANGLASVNRRKFHFIEIIDLFTPIVSSGGRRRSNSPARGNHFVLIRKRPETAVGYQAATKTAGRADS